MNWRSLRTYPCAQGRRFPAAGGRLDAADGAHQPAVSQVSSNGIFQDALGQTEPRFSFLLTASAVCQILLWQLQIRQNWYIGNSLFED